MDVLFKYQEIKKELEKFAALMHITTTHMSNVELLRELVKDRPVAVLVLLDDGGNEGDEAVPELEVVVARPRLLNRSALTLVLARLLHPEGRHVNLAAKTSSYCHTTNSIRSYTRLELPVVELEAVLEEELVGGPEAGLDAVLYHGAGAGRTRQLLYLGRFIFNAKFLVTLTIKKWG